MIEGDLLCDGFGILRRAVPAEIIQRLLEVFGGAFADGTNSVRARSSRGHVYAARNLIDIIPEVKTVWQTDALLPFLRQQLRVVRSGRGNEFSNAGQGKRFPDAGLAASSTTPKFGLVRALFFDKPPDRTWALPWHKDTSIAAKKNTIKSDSFSRPTTKAGVPHFIASDEILKAMLSLRIHSDEVTDENGPLRVLPDSHVSSDSLGDGLATATTIHAAEVDVLAMRPMFSHASGSSDVGTRRHRRVLHLEFVVQKTLPDALPGMTLSAPLRR